MIRNPPASLARSRAAVACLAIVAVASAVILPLRSFDPSAVDGAIQPLRWFKCHDAPVGVANHALEYKIAAAWDTLLGALGSRPGDESDFLRRHAALNAVAAALTLGVLAWLAARMSGRLLSGVVAAVLAGSSYSFLAHATNASQPMPAILVTWLALSVLLVWRRQGSSWRPMAAGALLAFAAAIYLPVILTGPALLAASGGHPGLRGRAAEWRPWLWTAAGFAIGVAALAPLLASLGATSAGPALESGADFRSWWSFWWSASPGQWAQLPLGFAASAWSILPPGFRGLRSLGELAGPAWLIAVAAALACAVASFGLAAWSLLRPGTEGGDDLRAAARRSLGWLVAGGALGPLLVSVYYEKLWLLPTSGLAVLVGIEAVRPRGARRILALAIAALWIPLSLAAWRPVLAASEPQVDARLRMEALQRATGPDSLVLVGWDSVSVTYWGWSLCTEDREVLVVPSEIARGGVAGIDRVRRRVETATREGRPVLVLGLINRSGEWSDPTILRRGGAPEQAVRWLESSVLRVEADGLEPGLLFRWALPEESGP